jgi:hypothetical protein
MTIWLLAVLLLASGAGLGYRQGAIRVACSFIGILVGAVLAAPLGGLAGRLFRLFGLKDPLLLWLLGPVLVFLIISAIFKSLALMAHQKVDVYYKYKAGDLRLALWERVNARIGLCLGLLNGAAYLALICFMIYLVSYGTFQVASSDQDPAWMRFLNRMGQDLQNTGFVKVARALDSVPSVKYQMADFGALLYRNPLAEARISSYPGFLALGETQEFQTLGSDRGFTDAWQKQEPIMTLLATPSLQAIRNNPDLLKTIWDTAEPDLKDVGEYLRTGHSAKYDPIKILGRWKFDVNAAVRARRRARPNMTSKEAQAERQFIGAVFGRALVVAMPNNQVVLKNIPGLKLPANAAPGNLQTLPGQWKEAGNSYQLSVSGQDVPATVEGDRLTIKGEGMDLVFDPAD